MPIRSGVAAPSANRFGRVSPTTAAHVRADLGDDVRVILDGGPLSVTATLPLDWANLVAESLGNLFTA